MRKNRFLFVAMLFAALSLGFVSCDDNKGNEPDDPQGEQTEQGGSTENNGGEETPTPEEPVTFTLTLLSSDEAMGTVTEGGTYDKDAKVIIEAIATKEAYMFVKWSDGNTENPRTLTMTENITLTAEFDYAYVDLGLPSGLKWATCNVGADSVHHDGNFYAWGETQTKDKYHWSTYKFMDSNINGDNGYTKYTIDDGKTTGIWYDSEENFIGDNKTILDKEDDAATVNMGGLWRMPTQEELDELNAECTWTWTNDYKGTGIAGNIVTSKVNTNSIFLPAAGYYFNYGQQGKGEKGFYPSSSLGSSTTCYIFYNTSLSVTCGSKQSRMYGYSIRGVIE